MNEPLISVLAPARHLPWRVRALRWLQRHQLSLHLRLRLLQAVARVLPIHTFGEVRAWLLRRLGAQVGERTLIQGAIELHGVDLRCAKLHIGHAVWIGPRCNIDLSAEVHIEDGVWFGHDVMILTAHHLTHWPEQRCGPLQPRPVRIGRGAWLAARVIVLPGVTIGPGSVVAAGSVVFHDVPPHTLVRGNPATVVRNLEPGEQSAPRDSGGQTAASD